MFFVFHESVKLPALSIRVGAEKLEILAWAFECEILNVRLIVEAHIKRMPQVFPAEDHFELPKMFCHLSPLRDYRMPLWLLALIIVIPF